MRKLSAIILAGGYSSRMHHNKAELILQGKTLLQLQIEKMQRLGITDIVISGYEQAGEKCRYVPDVYPHKGTLSGIHAGLCAIREERAVVLSVDAPLVPEDFLLKLSECHDSGICIAQCGGFREPLIGIYEKSLASAAEEILLTENTSVRALFENCRVKTVPFEGNPLLLKNCNTTDEFLTFEQYCKEHTI